MLSNVNVRSWVSTIVDASCVVTLAHELSVDQAIGKLTALQGG
jgi:hypothetical protein